MYSEGSSELFRTEAGIVLVKVYPPVDDAGGIFALRVCSESICLFLQSAKKILDVLSGNFEAETLRLKFQKSEISARPSRNSKYPSSSDALYVMWCMGVRENHQLYP